MGLDLNHDLFSCLASEQPKWWNNLRNDKDIYVEIRKGNHVNVYYNGGSIMRLERNRKGYKAGISPEYIPLKKDNVRVEFEFGDSGFVKTDAKVLELGTFEEPIRSMLKKRIGKFYPSKSEKGIQAKYITHNNCKSTSDNPTGFFVDSEFQYGYENKKGRIDLVWIDIIKKTIFFVELKTIGDSRLEEVGGDKGICSQLKKYGDFATDKQKELIDYYKTVLQIKKNLGLLPSFVKTEDLMRLGLNKSPVLLVGDCTKKWIEDSGGKLKNKVSQVAHSCVYQGIGTSDFAIPKSSGNGGK